MAVLSRNSTGSWASLPPRVDPGDPFAQPVANSTAVPFDPLASFLSLTPAERLGAMAWQPPIFPGDWPSVWAGKPIAPASPFTPPNFLNPPGQFPSLGGLPPTFLPIDASRGLSPPPTPQPARNFGAALSSIPPFEPEPFFSDQFRQRSILGNLTDLAQPSGILPPSFGAPPVATTTPTSLASGANPPGQFPFWEVCHQLFRRSMHRAASFPRPLRNRRPISGLPYLRLRHSKQIPSLASVSAQSWGTWPAWVSRAEYFLPTRARHPLRAPADIACCRRNPAEPISISGKFATDRCIARPLSPTPCTTGAEFRD